uniref:Neur_chan_LBD domain-containing protein n=1 Tax=Elaeophora elaphi TaxID=1147741 RepID=A0A0R3S2D8_9BILA
MKFTFNLFLFGFFFEKIFLQNLRNDKLSRKVDGPKRKDLLSDREIIDKLLRNYRFPDSSNNITVTVHISIDRILNDMEHECSFWLTIRQQWVETELIYQEERPNGARIRLRSSSYIWNPLITILNALDIRMIGKETVELHSNGMVELTQKFVKLFQTFIVIFFHCCCCRICKKFYIIF